MRQTLSDNLFTIAANDVSDQETYLYIDKKMSDHELFQAVCRVNRLDGDEKEYGYIIDYKDLFKSLEKSINDYTGGAFDAYDKSDVAGLLEDRLTKAAESLRTAREAVKALCENVEKPSNTMAYIRFFSAEDNSDASALKRNEMKRHMFYKLTGAYIRSYANLANEMEEAGFSEGEIATIQKEVEHYADARKEVMVNAKENIDMKRYEPGMRRLIDQYIRAEESETISAFEDMTLIDLIVERGVDAINDLPPGILKDQEAVAETIENNVRSTIIEEQPVNPKYYEQMSQLLDALIKARKEQAIEYKKYLEKIVELTTKVKKPDADRDYPSSVNSPAKRALFDNLGSDEETAIRVDQAIVLTKKANWRGHSMKERELFLAIKSVVADKGFDPEEIFEIVKNQSEY
ncbi:type I restriction endonuclease subunit R [Terasakiella sp. SH-1]|uniref:type I restriction enzyme subunit R domain-containing protein n=1 Tax=Terasakiella sp. SH-1 TaxID=2560057 RepID=UPI0010736E68|nr:type I restriction endonuclease subunit R [Terasakiella sp. SH-1]